MTRDKIMDDRMKALWTEILSMSDEERSHLLGRIFGWMEGVRDSVILNAFENCINLNTTQAAQTKVENREYAEQLYSNLMDAILKTKN